MRTRIYPYPKGTPEDRAKQWLIVCDFGNVIVAGKQQRQRTSEIFTGGKRAAQKRADDLKKRHEHVAPDRTTVSVWLDTWLRDFAPIKESGEPIEPRTLYGYRRIVTKHLQPGLGSIRLQELRPEAVRAFYASLEASGYSATTRSHIHRVLFAAMSVAEEADLLERNPMRKRKVIRAPKPSPEPKHIIESAEERRRLIDVSRGYAAAQLRKGNRGRNPRPYDMYLPVLLGLSMGLRAGEVCGLTWADVDLVDGVLRTAHSLDITPKQKTRLKATKTSLVRAAKMPDILVDALARAKERREIELEAFGVSFTESGFVCCHMDGTPYRPDRMSAHFRKMCDDNGFSAALTFHGLRHTAASVQESLGVARVVTQSRMGHTSARMTDHYIKAISADDVAAAALIDADLRGA